MKRRHLLALATTATLATVPLYNAAMALGHAEHDTAAVFDVLARMSSPGSNTRRGRPAPA